MKNFKAYTLLWCIFLAAFNAVVFLVRPIIPGYEIHYDARFWVTWAFVIAAFVGNLLCARTAFKAKNLQKLFYKLPLINVSYTGLILMLVLGGILMLIPDCPEWIAAIVCVIVAAFAAIAVVKAHWAGEMVQETDERVAQRTQLIRQLTLEAETLIGRTDTSEARATAEKVYEALRYSDPMSSDALSEVEARLADKFHAFTVSVTSGKDMEEAARALLITLDERNKRCRAMK